jgi:probable HAF family extracellular repeat protein
LVLVAVLMVSAASAQFGVCYRITGLSASNLVEALPAGVHPYRLNDSGLMTGIIYYTNKPYSMLFYSPTSGFVDLGNWNGLPTRGLEINERGQIAVQIGDNQGAMRYTPGVGFEEIGSLGGTGADAEHTAFAINESGEVAGLSSTPELETHAFLWTPQKGMQDLGTLGGALSGANGLNDAGWVTGASRIHDGSMHGFLYRPEQGMMDLGPGLAGCINNRGVAVCTDGSGWPMLCSEKDRVRMQSPWGLGLYSLGQINDHNMFVGTFLNTFFPPYTLRPFVGSATHGIVELKTLIPSDSGWELALHSGLNNKCQIVGEGVYQGRSALFWLDPIIPPLNIRHSGPNIDLSWAQTIFPLQLEESPNLQPSSWEAVPGAQTNSRTLPMAHTSRFYRLMIPPPPSSPL